MKDPNLPKIVRMILENLTRFEKTESLIDNFEDEYEEIYFSEGKMKADIWCYTQALKSFPRIMKFSIYWGIIMFFNNLKIAFRNMFKFKVYSTISISGLVIGITCSLLLLMYIQFELSYDKYHKNADNLYRIVMHQVGNMYQGNDQFNATPGALKYAVLDFPEVLKSTRSYRRNGVIIHNNKVERETGFRYSDPEFLEIFSFPLLKGDPSSALNDPFSIILTEKMANKYFGKDDPIGETLKVGENDYIVTGVIQDAPDNSHLTFNFLVSFNTLYTLWGGRDYENNWNNNNAYNTYILVKKNTDKKLLEDKITGLLAIHRKNTHRHGDFDGSEDRFKLQAMIDIHLYSKVNFETAVVSDIKYIYFLSAIGFLIILIASVNYINLSTSRAFNRAREIGVRKVVGASKFVLIKQFFSESFLFLSISVILALILTSFLLPGFSNIIGKTLNISMLTNWEVGLSFAALILFIGVFSGAYPALYLSSIEPATISKGVKNLDTNKSLNLRSALVVVQFVISIGLIICSDVVYNQLEYIWNKDLGFKKDQIIYGIAGKNLKENYEQFKHELLKNSEIKEVYTNGEIPISMSSTSFPKWEGKQEDQSMMTSQVRVDYNFFDFFDIEIVKGRGFNKEQTSDITEAWILNETAVKAIGWQDPIGKAFYFDSKFPGKVIGVVKDFHINSLHLNMEPMAIRIQNLNYRMPYYAIKIDLNNLESKVEYLKEVHSRFSPDYPLRYFFLDESIREMYESEKKLGEIFTYFTVIAIVISCLGLLGLVAFSTEQKSKEIGIRKVMGSSVAGIVKLLFKDYSKSILIANLVAWPLAFYSMDAWLENFAYKTEIKLYSFIFAGLAALIIAFLTMSFHSIKAARKNPVDALKCD